MKIRREEEIHRQNWKMLFTEGWTSDYVSGVEPQEIQYEIPKDEAPERSPYAQSDGLDNILGFGLTG